MKFKNLAWGAFIFAKNTRNDRTYQKLVTDQTFLQALQTGPSSNDFQRLRDFLTNLWGAVGTSRPG